ncbi:MAG: efflux RND transporter periplasmic adaptor subunit [Gemmataceae bacterium]
MPATDVRASANGDLVNRVQQLRLKEDVGSARRSGGSWLPWVLCGMLAVTWAGVGVRWYKTAEPEKAVETAPGSAAAAPKTNAGSAPAAVAPGEIVFNLKGNLIPSLQIAVSPVDVAGEVIDLKFKEGNRVQKSEVLAKLRDTRYLNEFNAAKATYEAAVQRKLDLLPEAVRPEEEGELRAQLKEAEANRVQARQEYERVKEQRQGGSSSIQDLEKAEAAFKTAEARVEKMARTLDLLLKGARKERLLAADADVAAAKSRMDEAQRMLENCVIKAPISGTILTKKADIGSLVSPMSFNVAASLCEIADLSKLEVEVDVPERQIAKVREKLDCTLYTDANESRIYRGFVDRVMPIADDSKNVVKVRVRVILPQGETAGSFLKPKMSATVTAYNRDFTGKPEDQPWE